ncbi:protein crumbs homolog 3 isoform X1 [Monodon monoceros]|uniref:protein crumbs homolog 3 isoform X1 n=1 Tax=Monodon monoceros TaxID=40151 RepID=UPI0010FA2EDD|nr:protein crumbs homolog 3 isoform X1 [Monodon monoceros]
MMGVRNPEWRKPATKSGGCGGRGLAFPDNSQVGVDGMPKFRWVTPVSPPIPRQQSQEATIAIIVVFSLLAALLLAVGLVLLVQKLREKRQTEGTYRPSSEEQFSHAAEAQAPQDYKETVRGCLPI